MRHLLSPVWVYFTSVGGYSDIAVYQFFKKHLKTNPPLVQRSFDRFSSSARDLLSTLQDHNGAYWLAASGTPVDVVIFLRDCRKTFVLVGRVNFIWSSLSDFPQSSSPVLSCGKGF